MLRPGGGQISPCAPPEGMIPCLNAKKRKKVLPFLEPLLFLAPHTSPCRFRSRWSSSPNLTVTSKFGSAETKSTPHKLDLRHPFAMRFLVLTLAMSLFLTELSVQCQAKSLLTLHRHQAILAKRSAAFIDVSEARRGS